MTNWCTIFVVAYVQSFCAANLDPPMSQGTVRSNFCIYLYIRKYLHDPTYLIFKKGLLDIEF